MAYSSHTVLHLYVGNAFSPHTWTMKDLIKLSHTINTHFGHSRIRLLFSSGHAFPYKLLCIVCTVEQKTLMPIVNSTVCL